MMPAALPILAAEILFPRQGPAGRKKRRMFADNGAARLRGRLSGKTSGSAGGEYRSENDVPDTRRKRRAFSGSR